MRTLHYTTRLTPVWISSAIFAPRKLIGAVVIRKFMCFKYVHVETNTLLNYWYFDIRIGQECEHLRLKLKSFRYLH